MDGSPSKRVLTETTVESRNVVDGSYRNDGVSDELKALLRNRGARVRKSVMEGYTIDRTAPPQGARTETSENVAELGQIFQSSRDINQRLLKDWTPSPFSSPKKRSRCDYEIEDALEEDLAEDMEIDPEEANPQNPAEDTPQRPIKPLRRTLFAGASMTKLSVSQSHALCPDHDDSCSENPFLE